MNKTVLVLGAGATKACGGPLTNEILPEVFTSLERVQALEREQYLDLLNRFLIENFHVPSDLGQRSSRHYPGLPLLLSLLDTAIDRKQPFGAKWPSDRLVLVRAALEYAIFALLEHKLKDSVPPFHSQLLTVLFPDDEPTVISLNYDVIIDNALIERGEVLAVSEGRPVSPQPRFPDYNCDIQTSFYANSADRCGVLLKPHGSLNWLYCPSCHRLDLAIAESGQSTVKALSVLYLTDPLAPKYSCHGSPCPDCKTHVRPVMITPTHRKDYRNPHISRIWYQAERELQRASRVVFVGYSLPEDDVEVIYLLKRSLAHLTAGDITVVEYDVQNRVASEHPVGLRYRALFGNQIDWHTGGLQGWLDAQSLIPPVSAGREATEVSPASAVRRGRRTGARSGLRTP